MEVIMKQVKLIAILVSLALVMTGILGAAPKKENKDKFVKVKKHDDHMTINVDLSGLQKSLEHLKDINIDLSGLDKFEEKMEAFGEKMGALGEKLGKDLEGLKVLENIEINLDGLSESLEFLENLDIDIDINFDSDDPSHITINKKPAAKKK